MQVHNLPIGLGSYLGTVTLSRLPDGTIYAGLTDMAAWQIESRETIADRFEQLADWMRAGADSFVAQGQSFTETPDAGA